MLYKEQPQSDVFLLSQKNVLLAHTRQQEPVVYALLQVKRQTTAVFLFYT